MEVHESSLEVVKTARYCTLGTDITAAKRVWFACHGYGQLARYFIRKFAALDLDSNCIIAPEGLHRFYLDGNSGRVGASWMSKEARLHDIRDYISYLDRVHQDSGAHQLAAHQQLVHFGFSQGVATMARYIAEGRYKAHKAVFWAGSFPPDIDMKYSRAFQDCEAYACLGDADPYGKKEHIERNQEHFKALGMAPKYFQFAGGHEIPSDALRTLDKMML